MFDSNLAKDVVASLLKSMEEELVSPSINGHNEFSTKEQSEGSAPLKDIGVKLHPTFFNIEEEDHPTVVQIHLHVEQATHEAFKEALEAKPEVLQGLVDLIRRRAGTVKADILNELREEIRREEEGKFEERFKRCMAEERINIFNEIEERYPQLKK